MKKEILSKIKKKNIKKGYEGRTGGLLSLKETELDMLYGGWHKKDTKENILISLFKSIFYNKTRTWKTKSIKDTFKDTIKMMNKPITKLNFNKIITQENLDLALYNYEDKNELDSDYYNEKLFCLDICFGMGILIKCFDIKISANAIYNIGVEHTQQVEAGWIGWTPLYQNKIPETLFTFSNVDTYQFKSIIYNFVKKYANII